jgi:hypothetical protein
MTEEAALLCPCAYRIFCVVRRESERLGSLVFFDDDPTSQTHGERIHECPGCGERLGLLLLSAQNQTR